MYKDLFVFRKHLFTTLTVDMSKWFFTFLFVFFISISTFASNDFRQGIPVEKIVKQLKKQPSAILSNFLVNHLSPTNNRENPKVVALVLTGTLGVFGAHRIYLGTDPRIPVFYTITLGGGLGVLPAVDFLVILFT